MPTCLLDKNVVRRAIEGIGKAQIGRALTNQEGVSLELLLAVEHSRITLFIQALINHFESSYDHLMQRLKAMTAQLPSPYRSAKLPDVCSPHKILQ